MIRRLAVAAMMVVVCACGGGRRGPKRSTPIVRAAPETVADQIVAMLPRGAQIVVEVDLARLRANAVVGAVITQALATPTERTSIELGGAGDNLDVPVPPLAIADTVVLAAYGVGTANAATIAVIGSREVIPDATRITDGIYALGPPEWVGQVEQRATLTLGDTPIVAPHELLVLRDRAMPSRAPGAALRITARLPADARTALARQTGLAHAPAQLSVWADVVDDFVMIIDADAMDAGDKANPKAMKRLESLVRAALGALAAEPAMRLLGLSSSITHAKLVARGSWIRTIIAVGPAHLARVVARATAFVNAPAPQPGGPS